MQRLTRGWLEATACVFSIGALSLLYAIGNALGAHPIAFILYAMIAAAVAMLVAVGPGEQAVAIVRHPLSWTIVLLEMAVWRRLPWRRRARPSPRTEESVDGGRNEPRRSGRSDGHPQRRGPDRERG